MRIKVLLLYFLLLLHQINWSEEKKSKCSRFVVADKDKPYTGPTLYHYTTRAAAAAIIKDGWLRSGSGVEFGRGVYFTSMSPNKYTKDEILLNNYGSANPGYAEYWLAFTPKEIQQEVDRGSILYKADVSRDIYLIEDDEDRKLNSHCF